MRKLLLLAILAIASIVPAAAQFRFGAEAGANFTTGVNNLSGATGFNVGVTGEYNFSSKWLIDASLKLSSQPIKHHDWFGGIEPDSPIHETDYQITPYYLTLTIRATFRFRVSTNCNMTIGVGPSFGIGLFGRESGSVKIGNEKYSESTSQLFHGEKVFSSSRFEAGVNARVGVELFKHYTAGLEYNCWSISGREKKFDNMHVFSLSVGYKF